VGVTPQDPSVQWVLRVPLEMMVLWDLRDHKVFRVMMVQQDLRVFKVLLEMMVRWVLRVRLD